jgi:hypothetical protein
LVLPQHRIARLYLRHASAGIIAELAGAAADLCGIAGGIERLLRMSVLSG